MACAGISLHFIAASCLAVTTPDETLEFFQEEARVITAARQTQAIAEVPMAVDVITADEIRLSGASNLWDLFRFRVGMDVLDARSQDGNRAIVSQRGFPHEYAGNVLLLVDGRSAYQMNIAGVLWEQLPVQMQDIDRIEIIRGPNAALYGTGAGVGVIHILTKKPQSQSRVSLDTRGGSRGLVQAYQAVEAPVGKSTLRISHTFKQEDGMPITADPARSGDDHLRKNVLNLRSWIPLSSRSTLEVLGGGSWQNMGLGASQSSQRGDFENDFQSVKYAQELSGDGMVEVMTSRNDSRGNTAQMGVPIDSRQLQYDAEALHRFSWAQGRLNTTYGTSYRNVEVSSLYIFGPRQPRPRMEIYRGFLRQAIRPLQRLALHGAVSLESSNFAGIKPNYQLSSVVTLTEEQALRASYSVAYTLRDFLPIFAWLEMPGYRVEGNWDLAQTPYRIRSYETGYYGTFIDKHLETDISLFYSEINDSHRTEAIGLTANRRYQNYDDALARGTEVKLKYRFTPTRWVYTNYTYEHVSDTAGDRGYMTDNVPAHKLNMGVASQWKNGLSASLNLGYKDAYLIRSSAGLVDMPVAAYWRLDARLAYRLPWFSDAEIYVAGQNLASPRHEEFTDGLSIPRTYQGGLRVSFGGSR